MKYVSSPSVQLMIKVKKNMCNTAHVKFSHCTYKHSLFDNAGLKS